MVAGALFPEVRRWHRVFARRLWDEIPRQCAADGTHFEPLQPQCPLALRGDVVAALLASRAARPLLSVEARCADSSAASPPPSTLLATRRRLATSIPAAPCPLAPRAALDVPFVANVRAEWQWLPAAREYLAARPARSVLLADAGVAVLRQGAAWLRGAAVPTARAARAATRTTTRTRWERASGDFDVVVDRGTFVYVRDTAEP